MDCNFEVVDQDETVEHTKILVKADCFDNPRGKWFNFTDEQTKNGRWKVHVEKQIEMIENNSSEVEKDLTGQY